MIEVGEYVRSLINGNIYKVIEISDLLKEPGIKYYKFDEFRGMCSTEEYNVKHSKNIIDLIEEGDYVNGKRVFATENRINDNGEKVILTENYDEWTDDGVIANKDIEIILTKEQMEANQYVVK